MVVKINEFSRNLDQLAFTYFASRHDSHYEFKLVRLSRCRRFVETRVLL